jgi:hypothetical protein
LIGAVMFEIVHQVYRNRGRLDPCGCLRRPADRQTIIADRQRASNFFSGRESVRVGCGVFGELEAEGKIKRTGEIRRNPKTGEMEPVYVATTHLKLQ